MTISEAKAGPVSRVQIARYACAVGDFNPIHLDEDFARSAGLPSVIAHGPLTLALVVDAVVAQVGASALRRFDARLRAPVVPGDEITIMPTQEGAEVRNGAGEVVATVALELDEAR